jgi:hypothetical protein
MVGESIDSIVGNSAKMFKGKRASARTRDLGGKDVDCSRR